MRQKENKIIQKGERKTIITIITKQKLNKINKNKIKNNKINKIKIIIRKIIKLKKEKK